MTDKCPCGKDATLINLDHHAFCSLCCLSAELTRLEGIAETLPKTKDGQTICLGDTLWCDDQEEDWHGIVKIRGMEAPHIKMGRWLLATESCSDVWADDCHSRLEPKAESNANK